MTYSNTNYYLDSSSVATLACDIPKREPRWLDTCGGGLTLSFMEDLYTLNYNPLTNPQTQVLGVRDSHTDLNKTLVKREATYGTKVHVESSDTRC